MASPPWSGRFRHKRAVIADEVFLSWHRRPGHAVRRIEAPKDCPRRSHGDGAASACGSRQSPRARTRLRRWVTRNPPLKSERFAPVSKPKGDSRLDRPETAGMTTLVASECNPKKRKKKGGGPDDGVHREAASTERRAASSTGHGTFPVKQMGVSAPLISAAPALEGWQRNLVFTAAADAVTGGVSRQSFCAGLLN